MRNQIFSIFISSYSIGHYHHHLKCAFSPSLLSDFFYSFVVHYLVFFWSAADFGIDQKQNSFEQSGSKVWIIHTQTSLWPLIAFFSTFLNFDVCDHKCADTHTFSCFHDWFWSSKKEKMRRDASDKQDWPVWRDDYIHLFNLTGSVSRINDH